MRLMLDTNVLVSGFMLRNSVPAQAVRLAVQYHEVISSPLLLMELRQTLQKSKIRKYLSADSAAILVKQYADIVVLQESALTEQVSKDKMDNHLLSVALSAQVACIVTGDKELLNFSPYKGHSNTVSPKFLGPTPIAPAAPRAVAQSGGQ